MPVVKISLSADHYNKLDEMAKKEGISIQDLIRNRLLGETTSYTPADAVSRALAKYRPGASFTLPELYGDGWNIKRGTAGVFGKQFFNYVQETCPDKIKFVGMTNYGRHAQYQVL